jgi:hypothetical protein
MRGGCGGRKWLRRGYKRNDSRGRVNLARLSARRLSPANRIVLRFGIVILGGGVALDGGRDFGKAFGDEFQSVLHVRHLADLQEGTMDKFCQFSP